MMCELRSLRRGAATLGMTVAVSVIAGSGSGSSAQVARSDVVTFTKHVAPILQRSCVTCHREGEVAPMSLRTYEEVRPWARSIKERVSRREMPPWFVDRTVGIREYLDDPSLSSEEIATIVKWVDAGAMMGNPADMPPQRQFASSEEWGRGTSLGTPDLVVTQLDDYVVPAVSVDQFVTYRVRSELTDDRWIKAIEARPTVHGRKVVHHMIASAVQDDGGFNGLGDNPTNQDAYLVEFVPGTTADIAPEGTGRLLKAGAEIRMSTHYHSIGEEVRDRISIAMWFHPKGYQPKYRVLTARVRPVPGPDNNYLDIPPGAAHVRHDGYFRLEKPAKIVSIQPHMHYRGEAMSLEAILPDGSTQLLTSVPNYNFNWQIAYHYKNPPIFPAGTLLHTISYFNNSASNKYNPDPTAWVGFGQRTIDEMANGWMDFFYIDEEEYLRATAIRTQNQN